ncbi:hypothetical protein BBBOND_0301180 [Babesia bigemina]|uniref:Kinetochore protein SPC25 n=1 Tax=Babesia bigemina TaxID=5866 RepID=A0A061D6N0_BABBI|nr:hypothetical protein BBBOND_0301180 [Babesia bigemina]CDR96213.1 hypothetical protein BBBOND_0301180 [Babesia bigemina]|eukprot:XP_012768399.1 hypothetical protein BBBOND_0301180 [Babesia bigemina]
MSRVTQICCRAELESVEYCNTELQVTAPVLRTNLDDTKRIIESYNRKQKHLINLYNRRREDVNHMLRETRCNYWASNLQCLNTLLGFTLCSEGDTLVVTFTHLGASNPTKLAFVTLSANKGIFEGISCVPMIRQFNALTSQVNEGVAFGLFVCNIRKEFKASFP